MALLPNETPRYEDFPIIDDPTKVLFLPSDDSPDQWVKHNRVLKGLQHGNATRFTREVKFTSALKYFDSLRELVETADSTFKVIAQECSAKVVDHSWKLIRIPNRPERKILDFSTHIPLGYTLTADTEVLREVTSPTFFRQENAIRAALNARGEGTAYWRDGRPEQFVQAEDSLVLVDIEPLIAPFVTLSTRS